MDRDIILEVKNLNFSFTTYAGEVKAVRGVDFFLRRGEVLGIIGESGSGKSVTAKSITRINPVPPGKFKEGKIFFDGQDITNYTKKQMEKIRAKKIRMIFQDPMTSLNPTMKIGEQIAEGILKAGNISKNEAKERVIEILNNVGFSNPKLRYKEYPHEYSGGMKQRAMIALAMSVNPEILIADEPTTALDVTTQAQILKLIKNMQRAYNTSVIMITHDLGVVANIADRVIIMYAGKILETGMVKDIFFEPRHPYTWGLLQSIPLKNSNKEEPLKAIKGSPPDLFSPPLGCPFAPRCRYTMKACIKYFPYKTKITKDHYFYCWLYHEKAPKIEDIKEIRSFITNIK